MPRLYHIAGPVAPQVTPVVHSYGSPNCGSTRPVGGGRVDEVFAGPGDGRDATGRYRLETATRSRIHRPDRGRRPDLCRIPHHADSRSYRGCSTPASRRGESSDRVQSVPRNSLVVFPLALALLADYMLVPAVVVTQTLVELIGMVVLT